MAKRKSGKRDRSGKLLRETTRKARERREAPNVRVQARLERFSDKSILEGKASHDTFDGIGQLHALGYFHNHGHEPDVIRNVLREYGEHYWHWYTATDTRTAEYERRSRGEPRLEASKAERRFMQLDEYLPTRSMERRAVHMAVVDHWGSDSLCPVIERLVNEEMAKRSLPVAGLLSTREDREWLSALLRGAFQLIELSLTPRYSPLTERELMKNAA